MNLAEKLEKFNSGSESVTLKHRDDKILFIDLLSTYIRQFAANPAMNDNGEHVGGFLGTLNSIGTAIRLHRPSRCVLIADGKGGSTKRKAIYSEYKGGRKMMDRLNRTYDFQTKDAEVDSQKRQLYRLIEACGHLPMNIIVQDGTEADDIIAYLSNLNSSRNNKSIIMSTDGDFLQLVNENISVWNTAKKKLYTAEKVVEEYGIHPNNFLIYKSINGDASDNIAGIKGIGPATLKKHFPELANEDAVPWDHIFAAAETIDVKSIKHILENKSLLERNTTLMRLDEQQISGQVTLKILEQFDGKIPKLNKLSLTRLFAEDRLFNGFGNQSLDMWLFTTFNTLNKFAEDNE